MPLPRWAESKSRLPVMRVALDAHVVDLLDPQAKQVVGQIRSFAPLRGVRQEEVNTGVLVFQAAARIAHDQAFDYHVRGRDANGVASQPAIERGAVQAAQREGFCRSAG